MAETNHRNLHSECAGGEARLPSRAAGQISLGGDLEKALALAIETLSRLYVQALTLSDPPILSDEEMARVIRQMRQMSYGQAPDLEGVNDLARPRASAVG